MENKNAIAHKIKGKSHISFITICLVLTYRPLFEKYCTIWKSMGMSGNGIQTFNSNILAIKSSQLSMVKFAVMVKIFPNAFDCMDWFRLGIWHSAPVPQWDKGSEFGPEGWRSRLVLLAENCLLDEELLLSPSDIELLYMDSLSLLAVERASPGPLQRRLEPGDRR